MNIGFDEVMSAECETAQAIDGDTRMDGREPAEPQSVSLAGGLPYSSQNKKTTPRGKAPREMKNHSTG